jgi:hypothetical protein
MRARTSPGMIFPSFADNVAYCLEMSSPIRIVGFFISPILERRPGAGGGPAFSCRALLVVVGTDCPLRTTALYRGRTSLEYIIYDIDSIADVDGVVTVGVANT